MRRLLPGPRQLGVALLVTALGAVAVIGTPAAWADGSVPYKDPRAKGTLTLCDAGGHAITSGSTKDRPTFAYVVSSAAPPAAYSGKTAKATVYAYQPRPQVDPGEWSGQQLSGSSLFSNKAHPMAEVTTGDKTIADFVGAYPPKVDGLVQLRVYLTAPNKLPYNLSYPTTNLRITGSTFVVVDPGTTSCTVGKAVSNEHMALPASAFPTASAGTPRPTTGTGATSGPTTATQSAAASAPSTVAAAPADPVADTSGGGSNPVLLGLLALLVLGLGTVAVVVLRSRSGTRRGSV
jgi:hypothetical protein